MSTPLASSRPNRRPSPRRHHLRRIAAVGAAGAVGLTAAVAIPAFASDSSTSSADETPATTTTVSPTQRTLERLAGATPEELNFVAWLSLTPEQQNFVRFASASEDERNFILFFSASEDERAAFADALTPKPAPAPRESRRSGSSEAASSDAPSVADGSVWDSVAQCESGGNWHLNDGSGFYGGLQFTLSTWRSVGGSGLPSDASRDEQIARAETLLARSGWGQWPACSARLGLR